MISLIIAILTIIVSSPFGGMLYFYHDFQAGWFPENWIERMLDSGISSGLMIGWSILIFSLPYSLIGFIVSHLLNIKTSEIIRNNEIN
ncbi:MAG: hypothetical protein ABF242_01385 [Flavobacteriales bacterium]